MCTCTKGMWYVILTRDNIHGFGCAVTEPEMLRHVEDVQMWKFVFSGIFLLFLRSMKIRQGFGPQINNRAVADFEWRSAASTRRHAPLKLERMCFYSHQKIKGKWRMWQLPCALKIPNLGNHCAWSKINVEYNPAHSDCRNDVPSPHSLTYPKQIQQHSIHKSKSVWGHPAFMLLHKGSWNSCQSWLLKLVACRY